MPWNKPVSCVSGVAVVLAATTQVMAATSSLTQLVTVAPQGVAFSGRADLRVSLWTAEAGGRRVAGPISLDNRIIVSGLYPLTADFGAAAFDGSPRFIQVLIRTPTGSGNFVSAGARQPVAFPPLADRVAVRPTQFTPIDAALRRWYPARSGGGGIPAGSIQEGGLPTTMTFDGTAIWVARSQGQSYINRSTLEVSGLSADAATRDFAFDGYKIWSIPGSGTKVLDRNSDVLGAPYVPIVDGRLLSFDGESIWALGQDDWLTKISPTDRAAIQIGSGFGGARVVAFQAASPRLWALCGTTPASLRGLDPSGASPLVVIPLPLATAQALAFDGRSMWVAGKSATSGRDVLVSVEVPGGRIGETVDIDGPDFGQARSVLFDGRSVWASGDVPGDAVVRVALDGTVLARVPNSSGPLGFDGVDVWVAAVDADGQVVMRKR